MIIIFQTLFLSHQVTVRSCELCKVRAPIQMLNQLKSFLGRSPPPPATRPNPPCAHPCCTHLTYCLKTLGKETLSQSNLSEVHSLNTLNSSHFSPLPSSEYAWDSDYGWAEFCPRCHEERCQDCGTKIFTSVTNFEDVLTWENREVWICRPCMHGLCPGWKVKILSACAGCAHAACEGCMCSGNEGRGVVCCRCGRGGGELGDGADGDQVEVIEKR